MTTINSKFKISEDVLTKCRNFAKASVDSSADKYAKRNQFNVDKIQADIAVGKVGEEAVYDAVSKLYPNLSKPDHNIYDKSNKSWEVDLRDLNSEFRLAVKSQNYNSMMEFGESWVFQGAVGKKKDSDTGIFLDVDPNHYVAFVSLNVPKRLGEIKAIVKVQWLHKNNLFKDMQKENLRGNKTAVYMNDLDQYKDELFQI